MKRRWALAVAACLGLPLAALSGAGSPKKAEPVQAGKPRHIMSIDLCNDLLLMMLVPKERIASVTYLAHDAVEVLMPGADAGIAINHGAAEEVVSQKPDLILASPWATPVLRRLASKVDAPLVEIDSANSFADIRRITRQIGDLVGEPERAEALIAEMDRKLAYLERRRPARPVEVVAWSATNGVPGRGTLTDEIIRTAGAVNLAARLPDNNFSSFDIEELLAARPDAVMRGRATYDDLSLGGAASEHPVIRRAFKGRQISYPAFLHTCGLPQSADSALQLHAALGKLPQGRPPW